MLEKEFAALGLNDNEREVYLAVLMSGKAAPARIAKETGINRTTVYSISRKLISMGLIAEDLSAKVAYLYAEKPEALERVFSKEEAELGKKKALARRLAQELEALPAGKTYSVPRIRFIEETDLSDYLYKESVRWAGQEDTTWWGYHDDSFTKEYKLWIEWAWKHWPDTKVKLFTNAADVEQALSKKFKERGIKILANAGEFDSTLWVAGDYIIMVQTRQRPHYLVEIHDVVLARNQRQLFKSMWEVVH